MAFLIFSLHAVLILLAFTLGVTASQPLESMDELIDDRSWDSGFALLITTSVATWGTLGLMNAVGLRWPPNLALH